MPGKSQSGIGIFTLSNCLNPASAFRHQGQSGSAGHGLVRHCPSNMLILLSILTCHWTVSLILLHDFVCSQAGFRVSGKLVISLLCTCSAQKPSTPQVKYHRFTTKDFYNKKILESHENYEIFDIWRKRFDLLFFKHIFVTL